MHLSRKGKFIRTDIWREGDYIDLWSVPHFLSGTLVGLGLYFSGFGLISACLISLLLLIIYEMFEVIIEVKETRMNRILDVVVGMTSFGIAFVGASFLSTTMLFVTFAMITILDLGLSTFGWTASHKAHVLENKLREEFEEQKERLRERRERRGLVKMRKRVHAGKYKWSVRPMRKRWQNLSPQTHVAPQESQPPEVSA